MRLGPQGLDRELGSLAISNLPVLLVCPKNTHDLVRTLQRVLELLDEGQELQLTISRQQVVLILVRSVEVFKEGHECHKVLWRSHDLERWIRPLLVILHNHIYRIPARMEHTDELGLESLVELNDIMEVPLIEELAVIASVAARATLAEWKLAQPSPSAELSVS
jgi:hypothetical protein